MTILDEILTDKINYVALAVPVFFLLIGGEAFYAWWARKDYYRFDDSINDLSCGIVEQVVGIFIKGGLFLGYLGLYRHGRLFEITEYSPAVQWGAAFVLFLGVDFCYYWFHRIAHEMNAPWAAHVVHHQSEQYNLTVALRQGTFQGSFSWIFYLPLAVIGFPPPWFLAMSSFDTLYQFWIHTRAIGRLGPLEWVFNTPSHHRVHHARNPKYIDKNYAGTLIVWDRLFGTFVAEEDEPVYGIVKPLQSWNPLWANFHRWVTMTRDAVAADHWADRLKIWFMRPAWRPRNLPPMPPSPDVSRETVIVYHTPLPRALNLYVFVHFVAALVLSVLLLNWENQMSLRNLVLPSVLVLWTLVNIGGIFEGKKWTLPSELVRLAAAALGTFVSLATDRTLGLVAIGAGLVSAAWLFSYRAHFVHALSEQESESNDRTPDRNAPASAPAAERVPLQKPVQA
jgi:alkylglycerol monooxygenase